MYFLDNGIRYAYVFSLLLGTIGFVLSFFVWFEELQRKVARVTLVLFNQVGLFQNVFVMSVIVNILVIFAMLGQNLINSKIKESLEK